MSAFTNFTNRLAFLFGRGRFRSDLHEEMDFHRAEMERELVSGGMPLEQARREARLRFGNDTALQQKSHDVVAFRLETVLQDVNYAFRQLRHSPAFAITAILVLALGLGVSVAIFGFVDAALLQPLPYSNPNRLMDVNEKSEMFQRSNLSRADYEDWKRLSHSFTSLEAYGGSGYLFRTPSGAVPIPAGRVTSGFFNLLGVKPMLGRVFLPGEDQPGKAKIVILSYGTWLKRFSGRKDVVGQAIDLSDATYTIVGVLPPEFVFAPSANAEMWVPLLDKNGCEQRRSCHNLYGLGRLRDGVSMLAARQEMESIAAQLEKQYPASNKGQGASVIALSEFIVGTMRPILLTLLAGAGLLLLIACVNVAGLLLVRSETRRREIAVRGALGATPARLTRQFVTEGMVLAISGCAGGVALAAWLMIAMKGLIPKTVADGLPFLRGVGVNNHTVLFALAVAVGSAILLAATPALRLSFQDIRENLNDGGRAAAGRFWRRMGANLVVVELTVAVVLLVGAGLLGKSFYKLLHVDTGFDTTHLAMAYVMVPDSRLPKPEQAMPLYQQIQRTLAALPGVESVGITSDLPVQCNCNTDWIRILGKPFHGEHNEVNERDISPNYLPTLKAQLVRGRFFTDDDTASKSAKIVINEALARKYFPGEDPIGKKIADDDLTPKSMREIVGVVGDVREGGLDQDLWPTEYQALYAGADTNFAVVVRTRQNEKALLPGIVKALHDIDPTLGVYGEITMTDQIQSTQSALLHRFATWLVAGFASIALVLGVVGLYGVIAYSVGQRTREIGVRMALGAQRSAVYKMVMTQAARLTAVGVGFGLICAVGASMLMRNVLFGVAAWDAATLISVAVVLASASLAASFLPAWRAASVNPTDALRAE